ncbi:hypothetical protein ACP70R_013177 [Stipagrostis hirtigluma subsp. patula]
MASRTDYRSPEERREGGDKMQSSSAERSLAAKDGISSPASPTDLEERAVLQEKLFWARMERQKILAMSAMADEKIWSLTALAQKMMQERDEVRSQASILLADLQARNSQTMKLRRRAYSTAARPNVFAAAGGNSQAVAATPFRPSGEMTTTMMQGQYALSTGPGYRAASSSNFGHMNLSSSMDPYTVQPFLHGLASSSQDYFDPDMFLVDDADAPPQDLVPATAGFVPRRSSGDHLFEQKPLHWKGKSPLIHDAGHGQAS